MFSKNMSYYEIINALRDLTDFSTLTLFQQKCLQNSLQNPFVLGLFRLYPAKPPVQQIINEALRQQHGLRNNMIAGVDQNLNVHSSALSEQRARTKDYLLRQFYSEEANDSVISDLDLFVRNAVANKEIVEELFVAHKFRLQQFHMPEVEHDDIESVKQSIIDDFMSYVEHLKNLKENNATFAWDVIASLLNRIRSLPKDLIIPNQLELMRALDDARTAYFGKGYKFTQDKDYSCLLGLEQRGLDHHAHLVEVVLKKGYEKDIEPLFLIYIQSVVDDNGFHIKYAPSQLMLHLYASFAGYIVESKQQVFFQIPERVSEEMLSLLQHQYIAQKHSMSIGEVQYFIHLSPAEIQDIEMHHSAARTKRRLVISEHLALSTFVRLLKRSGTTAYQDDIPSFITFWQAQDNIPKLIETVNPQLEFEYVRHSQKPADADIIDSMARSPFFIDKAHVLTILALLPLEQIEQTLQADPAAYQVDEQLCDQSVLIAHYTELKKRLRKDYHHNFYDFYVDALDADLRAPNGLRAQICAEDVLLQFLEKQKNIFNHHQYAILCVKSGYSRALAMLFSEFGVSPNIVCLQERLSLLQMACIEGSIHVVKVLLKSGAHPYLIDKQSDFLKQPLHYAASYGHIDIIKELLEFGADINQITKEGGTALMEAISNTQPEAAEFLIEAGAQIDYVDQFPKTVLSCFSRDSLNNKKMVSLLCFVLNALKKNKESFNLVVNMLPTAYSAPITSPDKVIIILRQSILSTFIQANSKDLIDMLVQMHKDLGLVLDFSLYMYFFANYNALEALQHCLEKQYFSIKDKSVNHQTMIELAISINNLDMFKYLLELYTTNFPDEVKEILQRSWFEAAKKPANGIMKFLKKYDKTLVSSLDSEGKTAFFHVMSTPEFYDTFQHVYNRKVNFSQKDFSGNSLLAYAAIYRDYRSKKRVEFLFKNSQKGMTPDDFEQEYHKSVMKALELGNKIVFEYLALYYEKQIMDNELFELSESLTKYYEFFERHKGKEVHLFAVIALSLLKEPTAKDKSKVLKIAFIERFALDVLSQLQRRIESGFPMSNVEIGLLNLSVETLWCDRFEPFCYTKPRSQEKEESNGLSVTSKSLMYFNILKKLLFIKLHYVPKKEGMLFEISKQYKAQSVLKAVFDNSTHQESSVREIVEIILVGVSNGYDLRDFDEILQIVNNNSYIFGLIVEQPHSLKLVHEFAKSVFLSSSLERYHEATRSVLEYAQEHHQKDIELVLAAYTYESKIQQDLRHISCHDEKHDLNIITHKLKERLAKSWYIESIIAIFALTEECCSQNNMPLPVRIGSSYSSMRSYTKKLFYNLLRSALNSLSKHMISSTLNENQIMTVNVLLRLFNDSHIIKKYEAEMQSQAQETASVSMTATQFIIEISQEMNRLYPSLIPQTEAQSGTDALTFSSKRLYSEISEQQIENPSKLRRLLP